MDSIDLTIYLVDDIVSGSVCMLQIIWTPTPSLPLGVNLSKVQVLTILLSCVFLPSGRKKSFGISHCIVDCLLVSSSGGRLNRSIEMLLLYEKNKPFMLCVFVANYVLSNVLD